MNERDLPRGFGKPTPRKRTAALANVRRAARDFMDAAQANDGAALDHAEYLLQMSPSALAKACGLSQRELIAHCATAHDQHVSAELFAAGLNAELLRKRVLFRDALALAKEIIHNESESAGTCNV